MTNKLLGVVLCGGLSTRMGEDKGMLKVKEEERWAEKMDALLSSVAPTILSINETQIAVYREFFDARKLIRDLPYYNINGPLRGLMSVHDFYPESDLLLLPCDMINFDEKALNHLLEHYAVDKKHEVIAPLVDNYLQPLATIYRAKALKRIKAWVEDESLKNRSMMHVLRRMNTLEVHFGEEFYYAFKNFNTPDDVVFTRN